jgi:hypothetical protein
VCKTPEEFSDAIDYGIEASGGETVSLDIPLSNYGNVIKEGAEKATEDWLQYAVLVTTQDSQYPDTGISNLQNFIKDYMGEFNFTIISQASRMYRLNRLATSLNGDHYSVKVGSDLTPAFVEALNKEKPKRV